ncbi:MAG TPA: DUF4112 domain-containing protein [Balneolaceae bacterium]|nr:DUF4112 domain-containing protein [Balneolaceae bacterium]
MHKASDDKQYHYHQALSRLERFSYWTDSNIRVPFTRFRFGLSPLIGLIPGAGDFAGLILSLYVLYEARKVGADSSVKRKMIRNMLLEFTLGLIPVVGDAFDAVFKANTRNTELLRRYLYSELDEEPERTFPWVTFIWFSLLILLLGWLMYWLFG